MKSKPIIDYIHNIGYITKRTDLTDDEIWKLEVVIRQAFAEGEERALEQVLESTKKIIESL